MHAHASFHFALVDLIAHARQWDRACMGSTRDGLSDETRHQLLEELHSLADDVGLQRSGEPRVSWWSRFSGLIPGLSDDERRSERELLRAYERACDANPPMGAVGLLLRQYGDLRRAVLGHRARLTRPVTRRTMPPILHSRGAST